MKILFVKPPYKVANYFGLGRRYVPSPLAEASLIAYLKQFNYEPMMLDCHKKGIDWSDLADELKKYNPDVICYSASMAAFHDSYIKFANLAKETLPNVIIVAGGGHFGLNAEKIFEETKNIDFIVIGEGEITLLQLLQAIENGKNDFQQINGLSYRENDKMIKNLPREIIKNMDELPDPDFDVLIELNNNRFSLFPQEWDSWTIITTGRGCVGNCSFCTARISQGSYRCFSPQRAFKMLKAIYDYGVRTIWIDDLTFNVNRERTEKLFDLIIDSGIKVNLIILSRVDLVVRDRDIMEKYCRAGVKGVLLGGESPLKKDLKKYNKGISELKIKEAVDILREKDILQWVFYIIGDVDHDKDDILEIFKFADDVDSTVAVFSPCVAFPGTDYYEQIKKTGLIRIFDYQYYDMTYAVMDTKHLSLEEIQSAKDGLAFMYFQKPERLEKNLNSSNPLIRNWYERLSVYKDNVHIHGKEKQRVPSMGTGVR